MLVVYCDIVTSSTDCTCGSCAGAGANDRPSCKHPFLAITAVLLLLVIVIGVLVLSYLLTIGGNPMIDRTAGLS